jgi:hypothetical protein
VVLVVVFLGAQVAQQQQKLGVPLVEPVLEPRLL